MQNLITPIWPTWKDLSDDLGLPYTTVWSWKVRNRIPAEYDGDIIAAAIGRGHVLTLEQFSAARTEQRNAKREAKAS